MAKDPRRAAMTVWHVAGNSGLGKTLLLQALVTQLPGTIRVLKHSHHPLEPDTEGSDTDRLNHAATTARIHDNGIVLRGKQPGFLEFVTWYGSHCDHLLLEGLKFLDTPKIYLNQEESDPRITTGTVIGPRRPVSSEVLWIAAELPLTRNTASDIAAVLVKETIRTGFTWEALIQALKSFRFPD